MSNTNDNSAGNRPQYSKIVLDIANSVLPPERLNRPTPSSEDGLSTDDEFDLRLLGCELIQMAGILLRLPQVAMATGQVLFHRFYYSKSMVRFDFEIYAMACIALASKVEEEPRRMRDVINVFHHMKQVRHQLNPAPMLLDERYIARKTEVVKAERRILKELGFCVHVKHPHKFIVLLLQILQNEPNHDLLQTSWNYMNDSLRADIFCRYQPEKIACACIYLSACLLKVPLANNPPWYGLFDVTLDEIRDICGRILRLYTRPRPDQTRLEQIIQELHAELASRKGGTNSNAAASPASTTPVKSVVALIQGDRVDTSRRTRERDQESTNMKEIHQDSRPVK